MMEIGDFTVAFGNRIRQLREQKGLSQEQLSINAGLHRTHISLIERGKRQIRLDTILVLAGALGAHPSLLFLLDESSKGHSQSDLETLQIIFPFLLEFQKLGNKHRIVDVFQDNGGKHLQTLILLGLVNMPDREGNDARDKYGNEYELKSVNRLLTKSFSTHHHLNPVILGKYRAVHGWYFSIYEHIELIAIYFLKVEQLEEYFGRWEAKWNRDRKDINNPKIPIRFVEMNGVKVYPNGVP